MIILDEWKAHEEEIQMLLEATFAASEGLEEGQLIGTLARNLLATTPEDDIRVFTIVAETRLLACSIFTRLSFTQDARCAFLLSPMAVSTKEQGKGLGKALLNHALDALKRSHVDLAVTYGDPAYYGQVGFMPVAHAVLPAPFELQQPEGWLARSLTGLAISPVSGKSICAAALNDASYW